MSRIKAGTRVEVTRIDGEKRRGYALEQVECLKHIGEFWIVGNLVEPGTALPCTPRRGKKREPMWAPFGMYAAEDMRTVRGAPRKDV